MAIRRVNPGERSEKKKALLTEDQWEEWIHHDTVDDGLYVLDVPLEEIQMKDQVRRDYPEESIRELAESIRHQGLLQPIQLKREDDGYRIVYGHRRFLAAKHLGLPAITAIVDYASDVDILTKQIVENIQREDLNPFDEAKGLKQLMELKGLTQKELAEYIGKSKHYISETISILRILEKVGHARLFDRIRDKTILVKLSRVQDENLLNRALEMVENGATRKEILDVLSQSSGNSSKPVRKKGVPRQAKEIETSSQRAARMLENFRDYIVTIVNGCEGELAADELKGLAEKVEALVGELKELLSVLFKGVTDSVMP
jgi:ParB/RepB/Spo0J family partition protein